MKTCMRYNGGGINMQKSNHLTTSKETDKQLFSLPFGEWFQNVKMQIKKLAHMI